MASDRVRLSFLFVGNYTSSTNMFSETLQVPLKASKSPKRMGILPHFSGYLEGLVTKSSWLLVVLSGRMRKPGECRWGDFSHQWLSSLAVKSLETITSMVLDWKSMIKVGHSHSIFKVIAKHYFFFSVFLGGRSSLAPYVYTRLAAAAFAGRRCKTNWKDQRAAALPPAAYPNSPASHGINQAKTAGGYKKRHILHT